MFLLRRRANSNSTLATVGIEDATSVDISGGSGASDASMNCSTPGPRGRTDQVVSDKRPAPPTRSVSGRWLSENEKARISIYLQIMNVVVAALLTAKDYSVILFEFIRAQGLTDMLYLPASLTITGIMVTTSLALYAMVLLHQSLVSIFSPLLLVNATFFTIQPYPSPAPASRTLKGRPSKIALASVSDGNAIQGVRTIPSGTESRPLIDLSGPSSEAGDTPPVQTVLLPEVLSPTQLQLRSLSPAFNASMQQVQERQIEEIMQPTGRSETSMALSVILSRRSDFGPFMYGRNPVERSMSTVSYPDIYGGGSSAESDEEPNEQYKLMQDTIYESEQEMEEQESSVNPPNFDTDADFDDEEEGDDMQFPLSNVQEEEVAFTSSPTHLGPSAEPEVIDIFDSSRQATIDAAVPAVVAMPVPHTEAHSSEHVTISLTPPPSRVTTMLQTTNEVVESPRDIFSPTPRSFPQPASGLPFAFPFLREQLQQHLESPPVTSISQWSQTVVESNKKKDDADEPITEPTPYPSPPFTPPSSRPPTMYGSMALQIPPRDLAPETLTTPDPFVVDRSPLSALAEEAKVETDSTPVEAVTQVVAEPDVQEPDVAPTEAITEALYEPSSPIVEQEQPQVTPSYLDIANEIIMPTARQGILRNPLSYVQQMQVAPPRAVSPLKSIGRGGLFNGSRIQVDEFPEESPAESSVVPTAEPEQTLVASTAEESFKEADSIVEQEPQYNVASELDHLRSGATSGADDESTAPKPKKKKTKKTKKTKKGVSFDEVPFVIGSDAEREDTGSEAVFSDAVFSDVASPVRVSSPLAAAPIPIPRTFEIEEEEVIPELISQNVSNEAIQGSPTPFRSASLLSELMSPRSTADELSDSSMILPPGQYSDKQVDHYGRWFARAHRDKALPTIQILRDQMQSCSDTELAGRLRLGSRSDPTKLSKSLVGEDNMKGVGAQGSLPPPPIRKGSSYRRRR